MTLSLLNSIELSTNKMSILPNGYSALNDNLVPKVFFLFRREYQKVKNFLGYEVALKEYFAETSLIWNIE